MFGPIFVPKTFLAKFRFCFIQNQNKLKLGTVTGSVIQANGRLTFEDDLRSGGQLYFTTQ